MAGARDPGLSVSPVLFLCLLTPAGPHCRLLVKGLSCYGHTLRVKKDTLVAATHLDKQGCS